jgi:BirA family transcriptional regulator, biotin operon repressor / biotin---[acetyl-CoA-carboxylase] ligase
MHLRKIDSTNALARELAIAGAPHGTLVTASEQTAGRGRQGRVWVVPAGQALLCSLVVRDPPPLLSLIAGVAVCDVAGAKARIKWPNDVVLERARHCIGTGAGSDTAAGVGVAVEEVSSLGKVAGILVEGRPQEGWAVLGIGVNVAVRVQELPPDVRARAASLCLPESEIEPLLERLLRALRRRYEEPSDVVLGAWRARDALHGRRVRWGDLAGRAEGVDEQGRLNVSLPGGRRLALDAGEVHLEQVL